MEVALSNLHKYSILYSCLQIIQIRSLKIVDSISAEREWSQGITYASDTQGYVWIFQNMKKVGPDI